MDYPYYERNFGVTAVTVFKSSVPSPVDPADMVKVGREIARLLEALTDPKGSRLDAAQVAAAIEALRNGRVTFTPPPEPGVVLQPWDDWSDLNKVPLAALGLRKKLYTRIRSIPTVGILVLHPFGQGRAGILTGIVGQHAQNLRECVAARGLSFAQDCSGLPFSFVRRERDRFLPWTKKAIDGFLRAHGLETLGDLSALTSEKIAAQPLPPVGVVAPHERLTDTELVARIVMHVNFILRWYGLPEIE